MADGRIFITISDERGSNGNGVRSNTTSSTKNENKKEKALSKYIQHQFFTTIKSQATQMVNYSINNIGNFTGDYQAQRQMQSAISGVNLLSQLGTSAYAGFKLSGGNPIGALVAVGLTLGTTAINTAMQNEVGAIENKKLNYTINQIRQRSGLNTLNDGSRGTEN